MFIPILISVLILVLVTRFLRRSRKNPDYKCFLITIPTSSRRRQNFLGNHNSSIPLELIYSEDTKILTNAMKYKSLIEKKHYNESLRLHYNSQHKRPDITHFNLGAIGCYMGHMDFYKRCFDQGLKYAVVFEDNVIVKNNQFYHEIQKVIDTKKNNFEMCFFHCLSRYIDTSVPVENDIERVKWISSCKCYLINVDNMRKYYKHFFPIDNHVDMKHEDIIAKGARIYYKDLRKYMEIDRSGPSTIGHSDWNRKEFFSRQYPTKTTKVLTYGY